MMENENKKITYSFDYAAVKTAFVLDSFMNAVFFSAFGFRLERIGPDRLLFPDFWLISIDHPEKRIRCNMIQLIILRTLVIEGKIEPTNK